MGFLWDLSVISRGIVGECCDLAIVFVWSCCVIPVVLLWYCWGIAVTLLWCCCGNALVLWLCYCGIHVESCGIDVEFPMSLLGDCCEIAGGLLRYSYCGIAVGLLWYCCDLAVAFL